MLFDDIETLLVLSKAKSLSQAADQLFMSRQGLSQKISNLEKKFGVDLVKRTSSGIEMTRAGEMAVQFAQSTAELERSLAARLAAIDEHFDSTLEVGMSLNDGVALLPRMVADYMASVDPDARIHLEAGYEPALVDQLRSGDLDFALLENQPEEPGITNEIIGYTKLVFIGPNKAPYNQAGQAISVDMLLSLPMIIYEWDSGRHMVGNRHFRERYGLSLENHNIAACFDTHEAMVGGVRAGIGWASVPECVYRKCKRDPHIVRFKVDTAPMWYPVSVAWSSEHVLSDKARSFISFIREDIPEGYFSKDIGAYINS